MFAALSFAGVVSGIIFGGALDVVYAIVGIGLIAAAGFLLYSASKVPSSLLPLPPPSPYPNHVIGSILIMWIPCRFILLSSQAYYLSVSPLSR